MYKKIYDPLHGFIRFDELENELITSVPFQRLYHIHQLGASFLVYPGATHKRYEHSLGVMELATRIYDQIFESLDAARFPRILVEQLAAKIPAKGSSEHAYWRKVVRLAALCHDLGHLPFSHIAESVLLDEEGHEGWTKRIVLSDFLMPIWEKLDPNRDVAQDVLKVAVGPKCYKEQFTPWETIVSHMITGDFFGSDRIDYLLRDARGSGLNYGVFDYQQMIEMIRILPGLTPERDLQLGVDENGLESCEALLIARHYMHKRVYQYPTVKAYSYHVRQFMEKTYKDAPFLNSVDEYVYMTDNEVLAEINKARRDIKHPGHEDALRLLERRGHLVAIPVEKTITQKDIDALGLSKIGFDSSDRLKKPMTLPFPVLKKDGLIVEGSLLSDIEIPTTNPSWIYISPDVRETVLKSDFFVQ